MEDKQSGLSNYSICEMDMHLNSEDREYGVCVRIRDFL